MAEPQRLLKSGAVKLDQSVESKGCQEFIALIKEYFNYLFNDFDFKIGGSRDARMGEHCLAILQSDECQFKFVYDRGFVEISLGPISSPVSWEDQPDGKMAWFPILGVAELASKDYVLNPDGRRALGDSYSSMSTSELMSALSSRYRPVMQDMISLFHEDTFLKRQSEIERHFAR